MNGESSKTQDASERSKSLYIIPDFRMRKTLKSERYDIEERKYFIAHLYI